MSGAETHRIQMGADAWIVVDWIPPRWGHATAVFVHGMGSHRRGDKALHFADRFAARGWGFLAPDLRGHGESHGAIRDMTFSGLLADLECAMEWASGRTGGEKSPILLIGSSMGGALAAWHTVSHPGCVSGVVLIAPALSFPQILTAKLTHEEIAAWRREGSRRITSRWIDLELGYGLVEDARKYEPQRLVRDYTAPTLIFHGMADDAVPWQGSLDFVQANGSPQIDLMLFKGGEHRLTAQKERLFDCAISWWEVLGRSD